jgi:hypothetical protein
MAKMTAQENRRGKQRDLAGGLSVGEWVMWLMANIPGNLVAGFTTCSRTPMVTT